MSKNYNIYVSSSCVRGKTVSETVRILAKQGLKNIELSGGHLYQENIFENLIELREQYDLNYSVHNYFPPPKDNFVLNIASCDDLIFKKTMEFYENTISLCKNLNIKKYGMHGGFLIDPKPKELGKALDINTLYSKENSLKKMIQGYNSLKKKAENKTKLYFENNVISKKNLDKFKDNPFLLTNKKSYLELKKSLDINLLLDLAHLKVSCNSLNLNFYEEANFLIKETDYIHLSGNQGEEDSNESIIGDNELIRILKENNIKEKTITLEIYEDMPVIEKNLDFINKIIN
jgi:sugar phosphate isomerase/epimerase|tara:strand:+ start:222 stop:1088 length:867 start_codon:yes stop_codon:yes gene_type:complete